MATISTYIRPIFQITQITMTTLSRYYQRCRCLVTVTMVTLLLLTYAPQRSLAYVVRKSCTQDELKVGFGSAFLCNPALNQISTRILALETEVYTDVCSDFQAYVDCMERSLNCFEVYREFEPNHDIYTGAPFHCKLSNDTDLPVFLDSVKRGQQQFSNFYTSSSGSAAPRAALLSLSVVIALLLPRGSLLSLTMFLTLTVTMFGHMDYGSWPSGGS